MQVFSLPHPLSGLVLWIGVTNLKSLSLPRGFGGLKNFGAT
jgi:hypothetical protein